MYTKKNIPTILKSRLSFLHVLLFRHLGTTTTEITDRKFVSVDGLRCKYLVRKVIRTLTKPVVEPPKPAPTKSKRGRTLRPKIVLQPDDEDDDRRTQSGPRVFEAWYPEVGSYCMTCFDSYLSLTISI